MEEMVKTSMTKDEIIMELMELLKQNDRKKQAGEVFEMSAYVDMLENKLDQMTHELVEMRKELHQVEYEQNLICLCSGGFMRAIGVKQYHCQYAQQNDQNSHSKIYFGILFMGCHRFFSSYIKGKVLCISRFSAC